MQYVENMFFFLQRVKYMSAIAVGVYMLNGTNNITFRWLLHTCGFIKFKHLIFQSFYWCNRIDLYLFNFIGIFCCSVCLYRKKVWSVLISILQTSTFHFKLNQVNKKKFKVYQLKAMQSCRMPFNLKKVWRRRRKTTTKNTKSKKRDPE